MAKREGLTCDPSACSSAADTAEPPRAATLNFTLTALDAGTLLHRIHLELFQATEFNASGLGNARFSPLENAQGKVIPTLYAGVTLDCALMETIFHDVPHAPAIKPLRKTRLHDQAHSVLRMTKELQLVDLSSVALRKLGIARKHLIDTEKDQYPATRQWAQALHQQCPHAQGLSWVSRQDDRAHAVVLFGDRVGANTLSLVGNSRSLLDDPTAYDHVVDLANRLGVLIVHGGE